MMFCITNYNPRHQYVGSYQNGHVLGPPTIAIASAHTTIPILQTVLQKARRHHKASSSSSLDVLTSSPTFFSPPPGVGARLDVHLKSHRISMISLLPHGLITCAERDDIETPRTPTTP
eukprot:8942459-Pyramimonas_sp.AAC.1